MNDPQQFEPPYAPTSLMGHPCVCTICGRAEPATLKIREYPFRWMPAEWSVSSITGALRCNSCVQREAFTPSHYYEYEAWITAPHRHDYNNQNLRVEFRRRPIVSVEYEKEPAMSKSTEDYDNEEALRIRRHETVEVSRKVRLKIQAKRAGAAVGDGLQLAVANEAGEVLVDIAKELTSELPAVQLMLAHPDGREVAKLIVALLLHTAAAQTSIVPKSQFVGHACELQMTASAFALVGPRLNQLRKHLQQLADIGEQLAEYTEEEMTEANAEVESELKTLRMRVAELEGKADDEGLGPEEQGTEAPVPARRRSRRAGA